MMKRKYQAIFMAFLMAGLFFVLPAYALEIPSKEALWDSIYLQPAATDSADRMHDFYHMLQYIIVGIVVFVFILLVTVVVRFNAKANKTPSKTTHNVPLEILWTIVPVIILMVIAVPSFKVLYKNDRIEKPEMTLKITGYQWYWGYEYPDQGGIAFESRMVADKDIKEGQIRLLSTDNPVVLPIDTNIAILTTASDVIHSWAVPAFGIKIDAVPARTNETWFKITKPGVYYGQCSEICGKDHSFMPIEIHAVTKEEFAAWVEKAKLEFSANDNVPANVEFAAVSQ